MQILKTAHCTVLLAATMDNYIYAFDGDNPPTAKRPYLWKSQQFDGPPAPFCVTSTGFSRVGILGTPVADVTNELLYFVTLTDKTSPAQCGNSAPPQNWIYTLHAISLKNDSSFGKDYFTPVIIGGTVPGTGDNATTTGCAPGIGSCVPFKASEALQRPALLDVQGTIYVSFGFGTITAKPDEALPYHGWVFGYKSCATGVSDCAAPANAACFTNTNCGLQQVSIFNATPNSHGGGIWMSARGPAVDTNGNVYVSVGNACAPKENPSACEADYGGNGYGESVVNLSTMDFFLPSNVTNGFTIAQTMNYNDLDMGAGGVLIVPPANYLSAASYLLAGSKVGQAYLLKTPGLGGVSKRPYQSFLATTATATCPANLPVYPATAKENGCAEYRSPALWARGSTGYLYVWGLGDTLRAYPYDSGQAKPFNTGAMFTSNLPVTAGNGGILAISAESSTNATQSILWAITGSSSFQQGTLQAYQLWDGTSPVLNKLWSSDAAGANYFTVQRFVEPLVSNGKVYVTTNNTNASGNYSIWVYGLCSEGPGGVCDVQPGGPNF